MSLFTWQDTYSVGHQGIDGQHRKLFQYADNLHAAMEAGKGKDFSTRLSLTCLPIPSSTLPPKKS